MLNNFVDIDIDVITLPWVTPVILAEKIKRLGFMIWFDSNLETPQNRDDINFDIITASPEKMIYAKDSKITIYDCNDDNYETTTENPFLFSQKLMDQYQKISNKNIPFTGGVAGSWGYELNHVIEPESIHKKDHATYDMAVGLYLWSVTFDAKNKKVMLFFHPEINPIKRHEIVECVTSAKKINSNIKFTLKTPFKANTTKNEYAKSHKKIKNYIQAGDCYQVNLTQSFYTQFNGDLWQAYKLLRKISPTSFSAWVDTGEMKLLSHSPEQFLNVTNRHVKTSPIKGTRARSTNPKIDKIRAEELMKSTKDIAENLMIVDLIRNDLNRYCIEKSVKVTDLFSLKTFTNVHHLVTNIKGYLKPHIKPFDLLQGTFPGGSITGTPKIRAMQIIRELEPHARTAYCGAIGYISLNGNMNTNIPIRTLVGIGKKLTCFGGGAIVADSVCEDEYQESIYKISNLTSALEKNFYY